MFRKNLQDRCKYLTPKEFGSLSDAYKRSCDSLKGKAELMKAIEQLLLGVPLVLSHSKALDSEHSEGLVTILYGALLDLEAFRDRLDLELEGGGRSGA